MGKGVGRWGVVVDRGVRVVDHAETKEKNHNRYYLMCRLILFTLQAPEIFSRVLLRFVQLLQVKVDLCFENGCVGIGGRARGALLLDVLPAAEAQVFVQGESSDTEARQNPEEDDDELQKPTHVSIRIGELFDSPGQRLKVS